MIVCAGEIESFDFAIPVGIGLVDSATNLTKLIINKRPNRITYLATAGSYGRYRIFDLVVSSSASQIEHSLLLHSAYSPINNKIVSHETDPIINSSNYITTSDELSKVYIKEGIDLENMEFFSLLRVAKMYNIDIKGVFVVTNYCNKFAHSDFKKNHAKAKELLKEYAKELV